MVESRILQLLELLQQHRYWHGPDLAARLGVSLRTLRRDVERLRSLGYQIDSVRGVDGGYQMASGSSLPPMVFSDEEAVALAVGLREVAHGTDPAAAQASISALAKLTAILPAAVRKRVELIQDVTEGPGAFSRGDQPRADVLGTVAQACQDGVRLRFGYLEAAERYVEPYRLLTRGRRWYLVAFDLDRDDWRTFRLDRMTAPVPTRNTFTPRPLPAEDLNRYLARRIQDLRPQVAVEFEVAAPADEVTARVGRWATVHPAGRGRARVTMTVEDLDWAILAMVSSGAPPGRSPPSCRPTSSAAGASSASPAEGRRSGFLGREPVRPAGAAVLRCSPASGL